MKDVSLKEKLRRGGAVLLVTMVCLIGLVGCGPEKPAAGGGKPGSSQTDPNKKGGKDTGGKITDGKNTGSKDNGGKGAGSKDNGGKGAGSKDNGGKPKPPATGKAGGKGGN